MKYINFKRYKLYEILKNINFRRYNFSKIYKYINNKILRFSGLYKYLDIKRLNFSKITKYFSFRKYNLTLFLKFFDIKQYSFFKIDKYLSNKKSKIIQLYIVGIIIFSSIVYICIPYFFTYEKLYITNKLCSDFKFECKIEDKIGYSTIPFPQLKIKNLIIYESNKKNKILARIENTSINLSLKNLLYKKKIHLNNIKLNKVKINLDNDKLLTYKKHFSKDIGSKKIKLTEGIIDFFDKQKHVTTIKKINFIYKKKGKDDYLTLNGKFLGDNLDFDFKNKSNKKSIVLKLENINLLTKIDFSNSDLNKNIISGKALIKKDKNRIAGIFEYKDDTINVVNANLRNSFIDGKFQGIIKLSPFFNFNLNMDLNTLNFNSLYTSLIKLNDNQKKNLFRVNRRINGSIQISTEKVFSKNTLVNSFESNIKFNNGNILIDKLLMSLGKLGAADLTGVIKNDVKFTNFKFENNIFIDNSKRFYSKFGVVNKKQASDSMFISGSIDLSKFILHLYEIIVEEKFTNEDIAYIESEFNNIVLSTGYESLFDFSNIKEFVKLVTSEGE